MQAAAADDEQVPVEANDQWYIEIAYSRDGARSGKGFWLVFLSCAR
jgi:hypothetical protein